jgi:hypothetical protein
MLGMAVIAGQGADRAIIWVDDEAEHLIVAIAVKDHRAPK